MISKPVAKITRPLTVVRSPASMKVIRAQEKEMLINEDKEFLAQHGPVRVLVQGGKKCNILVGINKLG